MPEPAASVNDQFEKDKRLFLAVPRNEHRSIVAQVETYWKLAGRLTPQG